jgi:hypothetical protein
MVGTVTEGPAGEPRFEVVILPLAIRQAESPAVVVDHNADTIRVVE